MTLRPGVSNSIADIAGLTVGHAEDHRLKSGVSVVLCDPPAVAAVQVLGGAPGTRETDLLEPHNTVQAVDAIVLSGGSAFGLDAASGVQAALRERGIGFAVGPMRVPIVPCAILFDLLNGGDKNWGRYAPYRELGYQAVQAASRDVATSSGTGSIGAGTGALTATVKGGLGTASSVLACGITVGAMVAVNALGSATIGQTPHFWAAPFELDTEFGGLGLPVPFPNDASSIRVKGRRPDGTGQEAQNTTIAVIATDAVLTKSEAKRLAIAAHDGFTRAIWPSHTPLDGDIVFALATGASAKPVGTIDFIDLCAAAASTMARAIARGVHDARPMDGDTMPSWTDL